MLILFDIDHTLLNTRGMGRQAMELATRELYQQDASLDGIEIAGRLDPLIWADVAQKYGIETSEAEHQRFRDVYVNTFTAMMEADAQIDVMPGILPLLDSLGVRDDLTLGLLTGNYPESGEIKVRTAGIDFSLFKLAAWGSDGCHRRDLPPVAIERYADVCGSAVEAERVVIIGDTPHDIDCARHNGCRSIGVATGHFDVEVLTARGADLAVHDLSDTSAIVRWLENLTDTANI